MTILKDGSGSQTTFQAQKIDLETKKSFRFLFLGGTDSRHGADIAIEAYLRAFSLEDDVSLIVAPGIGADQSVDIAWLSQRFSDQRSPDAELIDLSIDESTIDHLLEQCDVLLCLGSQATKLEIIHAAVRNHVALILPESLISQSALSHTTAYPILSNMNSTGSPMRGASVHPQDLAGIMRRVLAEPKHRALKVERAHQDLFPHDCQELNSSSKSRVIPELGLCLGAGVRNYSGYGKVARTILEGFHQDGANYGVHEHAPDKKFMAELKANPASGEYWEEIVGNRIGKGIYCGFHPPTRIGDSSFLRFLMHKNPEFKAVVNFTMFETDRLPQTWAAECNSVDEVWVPCQFNIDSFIKGGVEPHRLKKLPLGIDAQPFLECQTSYPIKERRSFNFLSIFDWAYRKGWDVLLKAYFDAFSAEDDVSLTIRAYRGIQDQDPIDEQIANFMAKEGIDPETAAKVILLDEFISEGDMPSLYRAADAFVLPSRGEGWGLPYMEAMASGLPTIGTRWSGQLEFMNDHNSHLIDLEGLVPVFPEQTRMACFYEEDHLWAQPSASHLANIMQEVVNHPERSEAIRKRGQQDVVEKWTAENMLDQLYRLASELDARLDAEKSAQTPLKKGRVPAEELPNVAWNGPVYDASGYADEGRNFLHSIRNSGMKILSIPVNWTKRLADLPAEETAALRKLESTDAEDHQTFVMIEHTLGEVLEPNQAGLPVAGRTMFETDSLPANWVENCNRLERIWVPSKFNLQTFEKAGVDAHRLRLLHPAIDVEQFRNIAQPIDFQSGKKINFLSVFDWSHRKGWDLLLRAWAQEFAPEDDVCLVLKVWSSFGWSMEKIQQDIENFLATELGTSVAECADIMLYDHLIAEQDMPRLYAGADAFVLATRGEGWGRPLMEAMASGIPTIATNWGGNTEFMNHKNSLPVDYKMVPCSEEAIREARWFSGHNWAECDIPHLRRYLRCVADQTPELAGIAARGRQDILSQFNRDVIGEQLEHLLVDLANSKKSVAH